MTEIQDVFEAMVQIITTFDDEPMSEVELAGRLRIAGYDYSHRDVVLMAQQDPQKRFIVLGTVVSQRKIGLVRHTTLREVWPIR